MVGDGNPSYTGALCRECFDRPYGTPGPPSDKCLTCWGPQLVWLGNAWGLDHRTLHENDVNYDGSGVLFDCSHECHDGELWLA